MKAFMGVALALAAASASSTEVYSTFNTDELNLFDCCNYLAVTAHQVDADKVSVAIPFVPTAFTKINEVDIALSALAWPDTLKVSIAGSENGLPGRIKKDWHREPPVGGQCCQYFALRPGQAVHAAAGGTYWIIVDAQHHSYGGWNLNTIGASGPYAVKGEDGVWTMTEGPLPAVRILAK